MKSVEQYFTADERRTRHSVFEQNHDVRRFYFDLLSARGNKQSIEHCWLRRTILELPEDAPMPFVLARVKIPPERIQTRDFSPIEYCCQSLRLQCDRIEEAADNGERIGHPVGGWSPAQALAGRNVVQRLQPLLQGSLLTSVNEGPKKMAEVFLARVAEVDEELKQQRELRETFRRFLEVNVRGVTAHNDLVSRLDVRAWDVLKDELPAALERLSSALQTFLN